MYISILLSFVCRNVAVIRHAFRLYFFCTVSVFQNRSLCLITSDMFFDNNFASKTIFREVIEGQAEHCCRMHYEQSF